ncbi:BrnT family toxin [Pandoraea commovens]|uniref:BrnT family toxin n=1 Tax=Pandoraea commovens TaxID=2508289 RepID=A0ABY5QK40_9BURK|nr:BrnT family toxin [Pandoraea commovens]UVA81177.1 BrnT family toxin [Pandoraea commovens]
MQIEFDPVKDEANRRKHGLSLAFAEWFDFECAMLQADIRHEYNDKRFVATGPIDERIHVMVFTVRSGVIRVISLRKANRREVRVYDEA